MSQYTVSFAQNREDIIIDAFFEAKANGTYVDVGANDPITDSVTKYFSLKGWSGVNIEPNPSLARRLKADRPHDLTIVKGVSNKKGSAMFRMYKYDGLSTFSETVKNDKGTVYDAFKQEYEDINTEIDTLANILDEANLGEIDFMKVDVEGMEYEVLEGNDWSRFHPELLCIEANHVDKDWRGLLKDAGYEKFFHDGLNEYYADRNSERMKKFTFSESILMRYPKLIPFIPHSDQLVVSDEMFINSTGTANQEPSTREQLKWAITSLRSLINKAATRQIIKLKRNHLTKKIQKSLLKHTKGRVSFIGYATPKITVLRVGLFVFNFGTSVVYKLRIRRFLK